MDAYAFSYAVMKYKYSNQVIMDIYVPDKYKEDFFDWSKNGLIILKSRILSSINKIRIKKLSDHYGEY